MKFYKSLFYNTYFNYVPDPESGNSLGRQSPSNGINALNYGRFFRAFNGLLSALHPKHYYEKNPGRQPGLDHLPASNRRSTTNRSILFLFLLDVLEDILVLFRIGRLGGLAHGDNQVLGGNSQSADRRRSGINDS